MATHPDPADGQVLLVTIQVDLQDQTALALQDDLAAKIQESAPTAS
jgi:rsbT antagonist protein RsbS